MNNHKALYLIQQIYATLFSLTNKLQIKGDEFCEQITSRQFMSLVAIIHLPENETTLNNIARKLGTTKQSVKQMITILESKGVVLTVPSESDKRAVNVRITESGAKAMTVCAEKSMGFIPTLSRDFSIDEVEILWTLLKKLYRFDGEEQDGFEEDAEFDMGEDTPPSHSLEEYIGVYEHPGYGTARLEAKDNVLKLTYNNIEYTLKHKCYDIFNISFMEHYTIPATFNYDNTGTIISVSIPFEQSVKAAEFTKCK